MHVNHTICFHNKNSQIFNIVSTIGDTNNSNYLPKVLVVACYSTLRGMLMSLGHRWLNGSESAQCY